VALLRAQIKNTRWPLAPRTKALRAIFDKLEPPPPRPEPFPAAEATGTAERGAGEEAAPLGTERCG